MSRRVFSLMALTQVAATSLGDGGASSKMSCNSPASCLPKESVLLQTHMRDSTTSGTVKVVSDPEPEVEDSVCDSCVDSFFKAGGCDAMHKKDFGAIFGIVTFGDLSCVFGECKDHIDTSCFPGMANDEEFCSKCAVDFEAAGGCETMRKSASPGNLSRFIPEGCWPCGDAATGHCAKGPTCSACLDTFKGNTKLCDEVFSDTSVATPFPAQCQNVGLECMEDAAELCQPSSTKSTAESCHTARKGEGCFKHVRWAMELGIHKRPDLYSDMSESSSFEDFQMSLHEDDLHGCPRPCKPLPAAMCHTAVPGEECHRHATWAKKHGLKTMPERYPPTLTSDSSSEDFQAWLSKIHHGDCLTPCENVEEDDDDVQ